MGLWWVYGEMVNSGSEWWIMVHEIFNPSSWDITPLILGIYCTPRYVPSAQSPVSSGLRFPRWWQAHIRGWLVRRRKLHLTLGLQLLWSRSNSHFLPELSVRQNLHTWIVISLWSFQTCPVISLLSRISFTHIPYPHMATLYMNRSNIRFSNCLEVFTLNFDGLKNYISQILMVYSISKPHVPTCSSIFAGSKPILLVWNLFSPLKWP